MKLERKLNTHDVVAKSQRGMWKKYTCIITLLSTIKWHRQIINFRESEGIRERKRTKEEREERNRMKTFFLFSSTTALEAKDGVPAQHTFQWKTSDKWVVCLDVQICTTTNLSETYFSLQSTTILCLFLSKIDLFVFFLDSIYLWYSSANLGLFHYGNLHSVLCKFKWKIPHQPCKLLQVSPEQHMVVLCFAQPLLLFKARIFNWETIGCRLYHFPLCSTLSCTNRTNWSSRFWLFTSVNTGEFWKLQSNVILWSQSKQIKYLLLADKKVFTV